MAKYFKPKVASANDLFDGDVVYLDAEARWVRDIRGAVIAETEEDAEALLVRADQPGKIVGSLDPKLRPICGSIRFRHREEFDHVSL